MTERNRYWFPAKRYGWGWGPPVTWQGWAIVVVWFGVLLAGAVRMMPARPGSFAIFVALMSGVLTVVCYLTGEPPRWRSKDSAGDN